MGRYEHDWPVGAPKYAVWGVGPLSQGSTAAEPVVLFHAPSNKARPLVFGLGFNIKSKEFRVHGYNL